MVFKRAFGGLLVDVQEPKHEDESRDSITDEFERALDDTPAELRLKALYHEQKMRRRNDAKISDRVTVLERKLSRIGHGQWAIGVLVTIVGIVIGWLSSTQTGRNGQAGADAARTYLATELPKHLQSTEETAREGGKTGAREFYLELQRAQQTPPLGSVAVTLPSDTVATRSR